MTTFPKPEPEPGTHGWAETRNNCPRDGMLRRHGFVIERRPKDGEAVWSRREKVNAHEYVTASYTETEAMTAALKETEAVATKRKR